MACLSLSPSPLVDLCQYFCLLTWLPESTWRELKSHVTFGTISRKWSFVVIIRKGLMMEEISNNLRSLWMWEILFPSLSLCSYPSQHSHFPYWCLPSPAFSSILLKCRDEGLPGDRRQLKISEGWQRKSIVKGSEKWNLTKGQCVVLQWFRCTPVMYLGSRENKVGSQTQRSLSSPPPSPTWSMGSVSLLFPSQAKCFPKEPGN